MSTKQPSTAKLTFVNDSQQPTDIELPILSSTLGKPVIDVKDVGGHGVYLLDKGFYSTASCSSKITFIDGEKGILLYRGYPIDELAEFADFMDICYLLLHGDLPTQTEKTTFVHDIKTHSMLHEHTTKFFNGFQHDAHPMAMVLSTVGALSASYHADLDIMRSSDRFCAATNLIAKMPTLSAMSYKYSIGEPFIYPHQELSYSENFLHMMFGTPHGNKRPHPTLIKAMDQIFILHADHEQNASTTTVRVAGSTGANPFACISAGIGALWGPAHGGANEACLNMLKTIDTERHIDQYIKKAKDTSDPFKLMGFGHRVYKNYDPRAKVMRQICHEVLDITEKRDNPLFKLAMKLEKIALEDEYFIEKKLYPNVDFYSGLTLSAIGIPRNMFTVIFALARTSGWISHWIEMLSEGQSKLARPRQRYIGNIQRNVPLPQNKEEN